MSTEPATTHRADDELYVVHVHDRVDGRIAGHDGGTYSSPPASRASALALVGLLLGGEPIPANGDRRWTRAVPGGRRTVTLAPLPDRGRS